MEHKVESNQKPESDESSAESRNFLLEPGFQSR
jgi:hypothetical protein